MLSSLSAYAFVCRYAFYQPVDTILADSYERSVWLAGQIIYVVFTTVIYNLFMFVVLGIMGTPFSFWGNVWSETAAMLGYAGGESITIPVSIKTWKYQHLISVCCGCFC